MAIKSKTKRKAPAKKTPAKKADSPIDAFGFRKGTKRSQAAMLFKRGCTMADVDKKVGGTHYNVLTLLMNHGHKVERIGNKIKVTPVK